MSKYRIYFTSTVETSVEVEAEDLEAAIDAAYDNQPRGLCHLCTSDRHASWSRDMGAPEHVEDYYEVDGEYVEVKS